MRALLAGVLLFLSTLAVAAPRGHSLFFGKWITVKVFAGAGEDSAADLKVRPLYVDGRLREYTRGEPHEVTDRAFVVQQAYRLNDALAGERGPQWKWQLGGWLLVERATGRVRRLSLPDYASSASPVSWYRDYAAYCGLSERDGKRYAVVVQLGRRMPLLRQQVEADCAAPVWQRNPPRVSFSSAGGEKRSFEVRGSSVDPAPETDDEPKAEEQP